MAGKSGVVDWLTEDGLLQIEEWARDGLTDKQIAEQKIGVAERTFSRWKQENEAIVSALKKGKRPVDMAVENALLKSALGYKETLREPMKLRQANGSEVVEYVEREIFVQPQVAAQIFWLKNRRPDKWRDKPVVVDSKVEDDGFIEALKETAVKDWEDDEPDI